MKDLIKQIFMAEQVYKESVDAVQIKTKEFQDGIVESQKYLNTVI